MGAVWAPESVISKSLGVFLLLSGVDGVFAWCIYIYSGGVKNRFGWFLLLCVTTRMAGVFFWYNQLVGLGLCRRELLPGVFYAFGRKKQLQWIDLSTWFLFVVFKGTSHKVAKHWLETEVILFLSWTCVIYQLYVVFPGVQEGFWFHFYTVCFTFSLFHCLTVTHNKI